jgi:hypothetical protein
MFSLLNGSTRGRRNEIYTIATICPRRLQLMYTEPRGTSLKAGLPGAIHILGLRPKRRIRRISLDQNHLK